MDRLVYKSPFKHALGDGGTSAKANPVVVLDATSGAEADAETTSASEEEHRRKPLFDWSASGVENGDELVYAKNFVGEHPPRVVMHDVARKLVRFNGDIVTITTATNRVRGKADAKSVRPIEYWLHKGRSLLDVYNEQVEKFFSQRG